MAGQLGGGLPRVIPPRATLLVLPEGIMINYLSRHERPVSDDFSREYLYVQQLGRLPPDYVILIARDLREYGVAQFGAPGNPGEKIVPVGVAKLRGGSHAAGPAAKRDAPAPENTISTRST